ncbi:hypothetical protein CK203_059983 [Vitis vinifera]|uniref:Uncharacterized protein n=1 Tax=Vitis vinifera TaxID=29760 RepID=A0A438GFF6_VITVI|nr:hypothetical protein CK203_059983 [Vitis vinifera]
MSGLLAVKYSKEPIMPLFKMSVANIWKLQENTAASGAGYEISRWNGGAQNSECDTSGWNGGAQNSGWDTSGRNDGALPYPDSLREKHTALAIITPRIIAYPIRISHVPPSSDGVSRCPVRTSLPWIPKNSPQSRIALQDKLPIESIPPAPTPPMPEATSTTPLTTPVVPLVAPSTSEVSITISATDFRAMVHLFQTLTTTHNALFRAIAPTDEAIPAKETTRADVPIQPTHEATTDPSFPPETLAT